MDDYDFHRDGLKPTKAYNSATSPRAYQKQKANT
jgi:hypothetical protein